MKSGFFRFVSVFVLISLLLTSCGSQISVAEPAEPVHSGSDTAPSVDLSSAPVTLTVSPKYSCYDLAPEASMRYTWDFYAEITLTNYTGQPVQIDTLRLYPNHMFSHEGPAEPELRPTDLCVQLPNTGVWERNSYEVWWEGALECELWAFGENQLSFPLTLEAGEARTGTVYFAGGRDISTGLPMENYRLDLATSLGNYSRYGMALAPSENFFGTYIPTSDWIASPETARALSDFLEDSQILLWINASCLRAETDSSTQSNDTVFTATDDVYRAASALILYLAKEGRVQPLACQSNTQYYSQEVFETVLYEVSGQHWDCSSLLQSVQTDTQKISAIPLWFTATDVAYSLSVTALSESMENYNTPETASTPMQMATVLPTYYAPSASKSDTYLSMPGGRPFHVSFFLNDSYTYIPFCLVRKERGSV